MKDYDHKIAKQIINYAVQNEVSVIKMENLMSINKRYEKMEARHCTTGLIVDFRIT